MKKWLGRGIWWVEVNVREHFRVYGWECVCVCVQARLMCVRCFVCVYCCCCSHFAIVSMCVWMWILAYEVILAAACLFFFCVRFLMDFSLVSLSTTCFLAFSVSASYSTTSITEFVWLRHRFRVSSRVFGWLDTVSYVVDVFVGVLLLHTT